MNRKWILAGLIAGASSFASLAQGAVLASYNFGTGTVGSFAASAVAANVTASAVTANGGNTLVATNDFYATKPVASVSRTITDVNGQFIAATITAAAGSTLNLTSVTFGGAAGGGTSGQRTFQLRSSVEGLTLASPSIGSGAFTQLRGAVGSTAALTPYGSTDESANAAYQGLSSFTLRLFYDTPGVGQNIDLDDLTFNGSVVAATVPEPATAVSVGAAAIAVLARRRRVVA